ncbi:MAG TPA: hypothetical protein VKA38_05100 [Draconibacterium sp.]|nr:hypothetical protein [Draconibacterium sp.]
MTGQTNAFIINTIGYAKSVGQNIEEAAKFTGDQFKQTWNTEGGFETLVKGMVYNLVCFTPVGEVSIVEQTDKMVKMKATNVNASLMNRGSVFNVSYLEYTRFLQTTLKIIADYMGADLELETSGTNWTITVKKK